jgi:hypothetical protein
VVSRTGDAQGGSLEELVERTSQLPGDWTAWAALGSAYVEEARITRDPSHYARAEAALARSLELRPDDNDAALTGLVPGQAAFALLMVSARRTTLRRLGSVACRFRQAM